MIHNLVICTRNRAGELTETLRSLATQRFAGTWSVSIIDGSDSIEAAAIESLCLSDTGFRIVYHRFPDKPSLARQRNFSIDNLEPGSDIVHFLDDDVTLDPGYLQMMDEAFSDHPGVAGIGATVIEEGRSLSPPRLSTLMRLFLLYSPKPGQVLLSGHETPAQSSQLTDVEDVQWLNGCAAYRAPLFSDFRFADILEGYSLDEDLDFSFRVSRKHRLLVYPKASMLHRRSPDNRLPGQRYFHDYLVHRYWFVKRNLPRTRGRLAFWWSTFGRLVRTVSGSPNNRSTILKGYLSGIRTILRKDHYLLSNREHT